MDHSTNCIVSHADRYVGATNGFVFVIDNNANTTDSNANQTDSIANKEDVNANAKDKNVSQTDSIVNQTTRFAISKQSHRI